MSLDADLLMDRRRLKRRVRLWQVIGLALILVLGVFLTKEFRPDASDAGIARLAVDGVIFSDPERLDLIEELKEDPEVKALIIEINSPGGSFNGGESLYQGLRDFAEEKPLVAQMGGTATSAGYMIAAASDYIIARPGTITGSIGVILQATDVTGLLDNLGIKPEVFKSGPLKAQPNPLEPLSDEARAATQVVLNDLFEQFRDLVVQRRNLSADVVQQVSDGRVVTGREAKTLGLVDILGDESEAKAWLTSTHNLPDDLPVFDVEVERDEFPFGGLMTALGLAGLSEKALIPERLTLDGVLALWHPSFYFKN